MTTQQELDEQAEYDKWLAERKRECRKIDCYHWLADFDAVITDLFVHCSVGAIMANRDLNAPLAEYAEQLFNIATRLNDLAAELHAKVYEQ